MKRFVLPTIFVILSLAGIITWNESIRAQIENIYSEQSDQIAGINALMSAVGNNDVNGVRFFSKAGRALINQKNLGGATALHVACREKNLEIVKLLINNGADVNATDNEGWTPLMRSALSKDSDIVDLLLTKGANAQAINSVGESAIIHATLSDCDQCLNLMFEKFNFIKSMDTSALKEQLTDAFIIARNRENETAQGLLESYLDQVIKMSPLINRLKEANKSNQTKYTLIPLPKDEQVQDFAVDEAIRKSYIESEQEEVTKPQLPSANLVSRDLNSDERALVQKAQPVASDNISNSSAANINQQSVNQSAQPVKKFKLAAGAPASLPSTTLISKEEAKEEVKEISIERKAPVKAVRQASPAHIQQQNNQSKKYKIKLIDSSKIDNATNQNSNNADSTSSPSTSTTTEAEPKTLAKIPAPAKTSETNASSDNSQTKPADQQNSDDVIMLLTKRTDANSTSTNSTPTATASSIQTSTQTSATPTNIKPIFKLTSGLKSK